MSSLPQSLLTPLSHPASQLLIHHHFITKSISHPSDPAYPIILPHMLCAYLISALQYDDWRGRGHIRKAAILDRALQQGGPAALAWEQAQAWSAKTHWGQEAGLYRHRHPAGREHSHQGQVRLGPLQGQALSDWVRAGTGALTRTTIWLCR